MVDVPPDPDDEALRDPESRFLTLLWDRTDRIEDLSTAPTAMANLEEILRLLEEAVAIVREELQKPVDPASGL